MCGIQFPDTVRGKIFLTFFLCPLQRSIVFLLPYPSYWHVILNCMIKLLIVVNWKAGKTLILARIRCLFRGHCPSLPLARFFVVAAALEFFR